jgi:MerR family transcriptional regulator/heat shock protein HspR
MLNYAITTVKTFGVQVHVLKRKDVCAMNKGVKRKKGYFSISAVAKMFSVHQQTIRLYEKEGLIQPKRTDGNTRMFTDEDIEQLEEVIYLTHELGINLAGVQMILKLQRHIKKLQKQMNDTLDQAQQDLKHEFDTSKNIIAKNASELLRLKGKGSTPMLIEQKDLPPKASADDPEAIEIDTWTVEYDE